MILLIQLCQPILHWEPASLQQKLWLRLSKVHHTIPVCDQNLLAEIADYFRPIREDALASGLMNTKVLGVNIKTLRYQVPGGMLI